MAAGPRCGRLLLVANPRSGRGRAARWLERARRRLESRGFSVETLVTTRRGDAEAASRRSLEGFDGVWAIGGDGTVNELVQGLAGGDVPLSILPAGTGNVVARELAIARRFDAAFATALAGGARRVDVGEANGRRFLFMVSAGFDAAVVAHVAAGRAATMSAWRYLAAIRACRIRAETPFAVTADGRALGTVSWAAAFNVSRYGGPFRVCPAAAMDDGLLHLMLLRRPLCPRLPALLWRVARGSVVGLPDAEVHAVREVEIAGGPEVQVDGDPLLPGPLHVRLRPGALLLRVP